MAVSGALTLQRMREEFRDRVPDLLAASTFDDALVDEYLNRAHRFVVPTEVPGDIREGVWQFETQAGVDVYPFRPDGSSAQTMVHALDGVVFLDDYRLTVYRRPERFWYYERPEDTSQARPTAALIYDEKLSLRDVPDGAYTVRAPGSLYPDALTDVGVNYPPRALAAVCAAAIDAANRLSHGDLALKLEDELGIHLDRCRVQSLGTPRQRPLRRSF